MIKKNDLFSITVAPTEKEVTLKTIQDFYEENICPNEYIFILETDIVINLKFSKNDLPHLLALHYFAPEEKLIYKYKSHRAYQSIKMKNLLLKHLN